MGQGPLDDYFEHLRTAAPPQVKFESPRSASSLSIWQIVLIVVLAAIVLVIRYYMITFLRLLCYRLCENMCSREEREHETVVVVVSSEHATGRSTPPRLASLPVLPPARPGPGCEEGRSDPARELSSQALAPPPSYEQAVRAIGPTDATNMTDVTDARHPTDTVKAST